MKEEEEEEEEDKEKEKEKEVLDKMGGRENLTTSRQRSGSCQGHNAFWVRHSSSGLAYASSVVAVP